MIMNNLQLSVPSVHPSVFAEKDFPGPDFSVYESRMHHWLTLPETVKTHLS